MEKTFPVAKSICESSLKATFHSTIFDIAMPPVREDQRHRRRFTRYRRPAIPVVIIIPFNFARCTLPTHRNRQVKSSLYLIEFIENQL